MGEQHLAQLGVSLLICTRNRGIRLQQTLSSISASAAASPDVPLEVILVDNGSKDSTNSVAREWAAAQGFEVTILPEPEPGLARARNTGLPHANHGIIAMTDDDCVLHTDYVGKLQQAFSSKTGPAIIGGRIELGDPEDLPVTIKTGMEPLTLDPEIIPAGFIMGANLAFTADLPGLVGAFDVDFGAGAKFVAAEDTEFLFRASARQIPIYYDPSFAVDHFHGRRGFDQIVSLSKGYYFGDGALYAKHLGKDRRIPPAIKLDIISAAKNMVRPYPSPAGIKRLGAFKTYHRARGFLAYRKHQSSAGQGR